jgi:hypothetical protein
MSIVEQSTPAATGKRTVYGIEVCVTNNKGETLSFNEFALNESEAAEVHKMLNITDNQPVDVDGIVYKRRPISQKKAAFAEKMAELLAAKAAG